MTRAGARLHAWVAAAGVVLLCAGAAGQAPLPEESAFFEAVRANLTRSGRVQNGFAYKERRTQLHMNPFGRMGTDGTVLYDVMPVPDGPGYTRRLLERDGAPVANAPLERFGQLRPRDQVQSASSIEDVVGMLHFVMDRREVRHGRETIVIRFSPRPDARPKTRAGRLARAFSGDIWVDEAAREVVHVEATAHDSISFGFGLVARLGQGTVATLDRQPFGDVWLPTWLQLKGTGRALLLRRLTIDYVVEWFDYRRADPSSGG